MDGSDRTSWVVAVGNEVLSGHTADSNSAWLAQLLSHTPYPCARILVIPDEEEAIAGELLWASGRGVGRIFCCGGLGPTPDDRTMAGVARMMGVPLVESPEAAARIRRRSALLFDQGRLPTPEPNPGTMKMALVPEGAEVLENPVGGAPPLAVRLPSELEPRWLFVLPGVPRELKAVAEQVIRPRFLSGEPAAHYRELNFSGVPESRFYPVLLEMERTFPQLSFGSYPQPELGRVVIRISGPDRALLEAAVEALTRQAPSPPVS